MAWHEDEDETFDCWRCQAIGCINEGTDIEEPCPRCKGKCYIDNHEPGDWQAWEEMSDNIWTDEVLSRLD